MKKAQPRIIGVNVLGAIGYMLTAIVWALLVSTVLVFFTEIPVTDQPQSPGTTGGEGVPIGVSYVVTVVMGLLTLALVVALPYFIGKLSSNGVRHLHAMLRIRPSRRSMFFAKSIATTLPLVGFFIITFLLNSLVLFSTIYSLAVAAAAVALLCFLLQLIIARALKVPERSVW